MRKNRWTMLVLAVSTVLTAFPVTANAVPPSGDDYPVFICPAINTHNPSGTNLRVGTSVEITSPIPLAAGVFW
ncbi:MAG: hypothetical protein JJE47_09520 [Acidimicrobiia bacterium]|nr:hypothetical protein [Acidimicrobiia bacterium]